MVTASIVTYNTAPELLKLTLDSFLRVRIPIKVYIIDNSPEDTLRYFTGLYNFTDYRFVNNNIGFGAAHNIAIEYAIAERSDFHFVVNPDIRFETDVISEMVGYAADNPDIGMMMPEILNEDGSLQYLPKLLPSPQDILLRKTKRPQIKYQKFIEKYELRQIPRTQIYSAPLLSGCFTLLNLKAIKETGGYDDRFFMYFEDWDLSRRMHQKFKTIYFPKVSVIHSYESGANKEPRLFRIFIKSAVNYFNKWGWLFDRERQKINRKTLAQFK